MNFNFKSSSFKRPLILRLLLLCAAALTLLGACWPAALRLIHIMTDAVLHGGGFMYLLEFVVMAGSVLVAAGAGGTFLFSAISQLPKTSIVKSNVRDSNHSVVDMAEQLSALDEASREAKLKKLLTSDEALYRVVVGKLQQWRAEASRQAALANTDGLKLSTPRWRLLAEEQAALIRELRKTASPSPVTLTDATWLVLPDQLEMLKKLGAMMGTDDYNVILRDALLLLFVAHKPGMRPIRLGSNLKSSRECEKAMACLDALMPMPEVEKKLSFGELRDVVRWWKHCANLARVYHIPGAGASSDSLEWIDTALVLPPAAPDDASASPDRKSVV